jgi:hypothetical protein
MVIGIEARKEYADESTRDKLIVGISFVNSDGKGACAPDRKDKDCESK